MVVRGWDAMRATRGLATDEWDGTQAPPRPPTPPPEWVALQADAPLSAGAPAANTIATPACRGDADMADGADALCTFDQRMSAFLASAAAYTPRWVPAPGGRPGECVLAPDDPLVPGGGLEAAEAVHFFLGSETVASAMVLARIVPGVLGPTRDSAVGVGMAAAEWEWAVWGRAGAAAAGASAAAAGASAAPPAAAPPGPASWDGAERALGAKVGLRSLGRLQTRPPADLSEDWAPTLLYSAGFIAPDEPDDAARARLAAAAAAVRSAAIRLVGWRRALEGRAPAGAVDAAGLAVQQAVHHGWLGLEVARQALGAASGPRQVATTLIRLGAPWAEDEEDRGD